MTSTWLKAPSPKSSTSTIKPATTMWGGDGAYVILGVQGVFLIGFSILYLVSPRTAHRVVGYFEEEAVISYTLYLQEIDEGRSPNVPAPLIARHYWKMADDATLRDVVLVVRADEAHHRDVNHGFANTLGGTIEASQIIAPYPVHATDLQTE